MKTAEVRAVFDRLKAGAGAARSPAARQEGERPVARGSFPIEGQKEFELKVIERFGYARPSGGSTRPCTRSRLRSRSRDIRLTTRYFERRPRWRSSGRCTSAATALYEHGVERDARADAARAGASLGLHESQSRMWENMVGRSLPFWRFVYPQLQRTFPDALGGVDARGLVPLGQLGGAVADPGRGGRGDLQPAHHPALRARAGAARRTRSTWRSCPRSGTQRMKEYLGVEVRRTTRTACSRTCTGRAARSATSPPTRSAT